MCQSEVNKVSKSLTSCLRGAEELVEKERWFCVNNDLSIVPPIGLRI